MRIKDEYGINRYKMNPRMRIKDEYGIDSYKINF